MAAPLPLFRALLEGGGYLVEEFGLLLFYSTNQKRRK